MGNTDRKGELGSDSNSSPGPTGFVTPVQFQQPRSRQRYRRGSTSHQAAFGHWESAGVFRLLATNVMADLLVAW